MRNQQFDYLYRLRLTKKPKRTLHTRLNYLIKNTFHLISNRNICTRFWQNSNMTTFTYWFMILCSATKRNHGSSTVTYINSHKQFNLPLYLVNMMRLHNSFISDNVRYKGTRKILGYVNEFSSILVTSESFFNTFALS